MPASDHLRPEQMKLFMTGTELQGYLNRSIDRAPMGSMEGMWKAKLRNSKRESIGQGRGTYSSLQEHGWQGEGPGLLHVHTPGAIPEWDRDEVGADDAHHRIAAAAHMETLKNKDPKMKPDPENPGTMKATRNVQRTIFIPTWNRNEFVPETPPKR